MRLRNVVLLAALGVSMAQTKAPDTLALARALYNEGKYDEAVTRATEASLVAAQSQAAYVVLARARLERFRATRDVGDLNEARNALKRVEVAKLAPPDRLEFSIALGLSLFLDEQYPFDDRFSAAAEQFDVALGRAGGLDASARDLLFEWWALALDRQAQLEPDEARYALYQRIVRRAEAELADDAGALSAVYWLAAGASGMDDATRAWGAAAAGWIRAGSLGARGAALREDLDRLVVQVILPGRAKQLSAGADARPGLASLQEQWTQIKDRWK